jgi:hypothetical protein
MPNLIGATVNGSGTKIAAAKVLGTGSLDTTKAGNDAHTTVPHRGMSIPIKAAINMGLLQRNAAGVLVELNPASTPTRVG